MQTKPKLRFKDKNGNAYPEWEEKAMEHFGTFLKGNNLSKADLTPKGYPCILYGELYTKYSEITEKIHSYTARLEANQTIGNANDVLIPSSGETAIDISTATCLLVNDVLLGGDLNVFRPKEQDGRFISYELNHKKRRKIASIAQGATVVHLYPNFLKKLKITLPCLEEQEKIAGFLSKVDELINECEGEVKDLEEQKKGLMQKIFSQQIRFKDSNNNPYPDWEEKYVNEVCDISTGKGNTQDKEDNGIYPFYVRSPIIERSNKYIFDGEAVLTVGDGVGTGKVYHYVNGKFNFHQRVYKMSNFNGILGKYFYYYFSTHFYDRVKKMTAKTSVDSVRLEMISKMTLLTPCLEEQEKIAKVLSKMDELIEEKKALLSDWQQFKKGLLQQMFV